MRCGKVRHRTFVGAMVALRKMKIVSLRPYQCPTCNAWHLGTDRDMLVYRIDQLLEQSKKRDTEKRKETQ